MDRKMAEKMCEINHNSPAEEPAPADLEPLRDAAAAGDARSQFQLGMHYANGFGVRQDDQMAGHWHLRAA
jgi:TPR repeat protein